MSNLRVDNSTLQKEIREVQKKCEPYYQRMTQLYMLHTQPRYIVKKDLTEVVEYSYIWLNEDVKKEYEYLAEEIRKMHKGLVKKYNLSID